MASIVPCATLCAVIEPHGLKAGNGSPPHGTETHAASPLRPFTPDERRRHSAAEVRKAMRREMEQRFLAIR